MFALGLSSQALAKSSGLPDQLVGHNSLLGQVVGLGHISDVGLPAVFFRLESSVNSLSL